jgi:transcriptional regulator with XRE-family HTH domain
VEQEQLAFATRLRTLRTQKRFSARALASSGQLSATYLRTLEQGRDPRTGKLIQPSVEVLRRLARALGDGREDEAERVFRCLMDAAGYTSGPTVQPAPPQQGPATIEPIIESIRRTPELSDDDKEAFIHLIKRSRRIPGGERDPGAPADAARSGDPAVFREIGHPAG